MRKKPGRKRRLGRFVLGFALCAALVGAAWEMISPLLSAGSETVYESYTAQRRDIATSKSFSASLNVLNSETHTNARQVSSIRKLYVQSGQQVKKNDKLLQLDDGTLYRAGISGTVNEMRFGEGDWVWPSVQLVQICDLENLEVSLQVDEYDVDKVSAGQKCTVTIVALGLDFETEIAHVNRLSSGSGSVAYYDVTAELTVPPNVLPGMTASVSIPSEEKQNVVSLAMAALSFNEHKQPFVWIRTGDTYEQRVLETGLNDGMYVEILSGLEEGDVVYAAHEQPIETQSFSLADLYRRIVGEKVVINQIHEGGSRSGFGAMPAGMNAPGERPASEGSGQERPYQESTGGGKP